MSTRTLVLFGIMIIAAVVGLTWIEGESSSYVNEPVRISTRTRPTPPSVNGSSVRAVGVMINAPTHTGDEPGGDDLWGVDLAFFGTFERTRMALELVYPEGGVIDLLNEESTLEMFEDDKGKDLRKEDAVFGPFEMMPRISEDGTHLVFVVPSDELPFASSTKLHARGTAALLVAQESDVDVAEDVLLRAGAEFSVGGYDFQITEAGKSQWGEGWSLTLATKRDPSAVVSYSVRTEEGRTVELKPSMSMSGGGTWQQTLEMDEPLKRGDFVLEAWRDPRTVNVPFEVTAGLGLR